MRVVLMTMLALASGFASAASAAAQDATVEIRSLEEGASSPAASIEELAWLVGHWKGEGLGGVSEEIVAPPQGGQMMGMFRQTKADGSLMFYEFYLFAEVEGSLELRIKHFNPDFSGWEEKDDYVAFPLVAVEEQAVYFDGLTFKMTGPDEMRAEVMIDNQKPAIFIYKKL